MNTSLDADAYNRHAPRLLALAAALVGPAAAGDIVSSAITRLIATEPARRIENLEAYLTRAVVNEARSWRRSSARRGARDARWVRQAADRPDDTTQALSDPALTAAILGLPIRQRAVVFLSYWADLEPAAVAAQLGISEGSVRKHLARARASLREALA